MMYYQTNSHNEEWMKADRELSARHCWHISFTNNKNDFKVPSSNTNYSSASSLPHQGRDAEALAILLNQCYTSNVNKIAILRK